MARPSCWTWTILDTQVFLSRLNLPDRPFWERAINRWHYRQVKRLLPDKLRNFDSLWISNPDEDNSGDELREFTDKLYLPNIPFQVAEEPIDLGVPLPPRGRCGHRSCPPLRGQFLGLAQ